MAKNNSLSPAVQDRIGRSKTFEIDISFENKSNEPNITLGHLVNLFQSLKESFKPGQKVNFPQAYSFTLLDGAQEKISAQGQSFPLVVDSFRITDALNQLNAATGPIAYINSRLYPDDVISILATSRSFLARWYQNVEGSFSWSYNLSSLQSEINQAKKDNRTENLQRIALGDLQDAVKETAEVFLNLQQKLQDEQLVETDQIEPLLTAIQINPIKAWEQNVKEIVLALTKANLGSRVVLTAHQTYKVQDVRTLFNKLFDEFKNSDQFKKLSKPLQDKFSYQRTDYCFANIELIEETIQASDRNKADRFLVLFKNVLSELSKKVAAEPGVEETEQDEDTEDAGGEEAEEIKKETRHLTQKEIYQQLEKFLQNQSWPIFLENYQNLSINPNSFSKNQKNELRRLYQEKVTQLIDSYSVQKNLSARLQTWLEKTYGKEAVNQADETEQKYTLGPEQNEDLQTNLAEFFFASYNDQFIELIKTIDQLEVKELSDQKKEAQILDQLTGKQDLAKTVIPPTPNLEKIAQESDPRLARERSKFIAEATTAFIGLYFENIDLSQQQRQELRSLIATALTKHLAEIPTKQLAEGSSRGIILNKIFPKIFLDSEFSSQFFEIGQEIYTGQLQSVGIKDEVDILNVYNAVDSFILLVDDPEAVISRLSDKEIKLNFNLPQSVNNIDEFKKIIISLIRLRQAHQVYHQRLKITPLLIGEAGRNELYQNQIAYLIPTKVVIKNYGTVGAAFLQDEESIKQANLDQEQKSFVQELRNNLWKNTISNLEQDEIIQVYLEYGVTEYEIEWQELPAPKYFSYVELAQLAGASEDLLSSEQAQKAAFARSIFSNAEASGGLKNRFNKMLGKKATKAILAAVAPEVLPVLNTLEKLPIIGEQIEKKYKEVSKLAKLAALAGAGILALLGFIFRSLQAVLGGIIGSVVGGIIGSIVPAIGTALGAFAGGILGGIIGNWIGEAGGLGSALGLETGTTAAATGTSAGTAAALGRGGGAIAGAASGTGGVVAATGATLIAGYAVSNHMSSGSQIRPMSETVEDLQDPGDGTYDPGTGAPSPYVEITKTPSPEEADDAPLTATYHISINPKGYDLTITNVTDEVEVYMENDFTGVAPSRTLDDFPELEEGMVIDGVEGFEFEYEQTYSQDFQDSMIANTFTLSFDYCKNEGGEATPSAEPTTEPTAEPTNEPEPTDGPTECPTGGGNAEAATIATVIIGDAPTAKDGCWPTTGTISQYPFEEFSHVSHDGAGNIIPNTGDDAVDIANNMGTPICSPFNGVVTQIISANSGSGYGNAVVIEGGGGKFIFGHFSALSVSSGQSVSPGTLLGKMGNTGFSTGSHLHYSRANMETNPPRFYSYPLSSTSILLTLHQGTPEEINSCCIFSE